MIPAQEALQRLRDGNRRFVARLAEGGLPARKLELTQEQRPFAIVLGCSDARVPAELVFDQGLGDLFVIRVAGNIVAPSQIGSIEFAASRFGTRLVVVLGHSQCGAVEATVEELQRPAAAQSRNLRAIVDRVAPAVELLMRAGLQGPALHASAVRANVSVSVNHLRHGSALLEQLIQREGLLIVGAEYSIETGRVEFLDGDAHAATLPAAAR
ncbi:MAG TPA: carbonic anhydrase [Candidatus Binatia bacterium]|nr:carbonic anhydrase [Candidatus Binatia bacterium]